jgi:hypothetical protein
VDVDDGRHAVSGDGVHSLNVAGEKSRRGDAKVTPDIPRETPKRFPNSPAFEHVFLVWLAGLGTAFLAQKGFEAWNGFLLISRS